MCQTGNLLSDVLIRKLIVGMSWNLKWKLVKVDTSAQTYKFWDSHVISIWGRGLFIPNSIKLNI